MGAITTSASMGLHVTRLHKLAHAHNAPTPHGSATTCACSVIKCDVTPVCCSPLASFSSNLLLCLSAQINAGRSPWSPTGVCPVARLFGHMLRANHSVESASKRCPNLLITLTHYFHRGMLPKCLAAFVTLAPSQHAHDGVGL